MAGETVMRVSADMDLDASRLPISLRKAGEQIGAEADKAGKDYGKRFDANVTPRMREAAARLEKMLNESVTLKGDVLRRNEGLIRTFGRNGESVFDRLGNSALASAVKLETSFRRSAENVRTALGNTFRDLVTDSGQVDHSFSKLGLSWSDLSHNARQWTLIIGVVAAAMVDLAGLSSALGAGIFAVGGALSAAVLGAGAFVTVASVLFSDISKLPPALHETVLQAQAFGKGLNDLRFIMADNAFQQMPGAFVRLGKTVQDLTPDLAGLAGAAGKTFDRLTQGLTKGSAGFTEVQGLIRNATDDLPKLADATGTWATALLRGVNKANPMVEQLLGYIGELGDRFDRFTRSASFDTWVRQSMGTFTEFGKLLDVTGRMLNNLVTPDSVARTQQFLRDLSGFMPVLGQLLGLLGELNIFGLAAQLLNEFGAALAPLLPPLTQLAGELSSVASIALTALAPAIKSVAEVAAPVVQILANIIGAIPPDALASLVTGLGLLAGAFFVLKGAQGVAGVVDAMGLATGAFGTASVAAGNLAGILRGLVGKAGAIGLLTAATMGAVQAFGEWTNEVGGWNETARGLVGTNAGLQESFAKLRPLDNLKGADFNAALQGLVELQGGFLGLDWPITQAQFSASTLGGVLGKLDETMGKLPVPQIQSQFQAWAKETNATDRQLEAMLGRMPGVSEQLRGMATQLGYAGTNQDILNLAMGQGAISTQAAAAGLAATSGAAANAAAQIDLTNQKLAALAQQELISRDAGRQFYDSMDQLSASIAANGTTLDIHTAAGRANEAALDALAGATMKFSDETLKQTGSQVAANGVISEGRAKLIEMLGAFGITGQAADDYANKLGLIPKDVNTTVTASGLAGAIEQTGSLKYMLESINGSVYSYQMRGEYIQLGNREITPPTATGGTFAGPQKRLIGEAGPEAVVPLRRPLSQVDPSVRWLSAIAQGMTPRMASGGIGGTPSRTVIFEAGSIVVQGMTDGHDAALEVANVIAERIAS